MLDVCEGLKSAAVNSCHACNILHTCVKPSASDDDAWFQQVSQETLCLMLT